MSKQETKKPSLTQPELPNIPPKPELEPVNFKGIFIHTIKDINRKKPDKIRVSLSSENHPYHMYEVADKLQKLLQLINKEGYHLVDRVITDHNNEIKNLSSLSITKNESESTN